MDFRCYQDSRITEPNLMDFELDGKDYRCETINALDQFHIVRKLSPVLGGVAKTIVAGAQGGTVIGFFDNTQSVAIALAGMSKADADFVLFSLLGSVKRKMTDGNRGIGWTPIVTGQAILFIDITLMQILEIAYKALMFNCGSFFQDLRAMIQNEVTTE